MEIKERILKALEKQGQLATYQIKVFAKIGYEQALKTALEELLKENKIEKIEDVIRDLELPIN